MDVGPDELLELSDDSVDWVLRYILLPALRWHLEELPSVASKEEHRASTFADEVLQVAMDDCLRYLVLAPLSGIALPHHSKPIIVSNR
jgi:hypothetical protein